jgi:RNA polymerase sigma factor (sigma-70 family)
MERSDEAGLIRAFLSLYNDLLRLLSWKTGSPDIAADLAQETYLKLAAKPAEDIVQNPRAYILRTASNLAIDRLRQERRSSVLHAADGHAEEVEDPAVQAEAGLIAQERLRLLNQSLLELAPNVRRALLLNRVEGLTQAEIARRLGVSESMVTKYIAQALRHCRAWREGADD